MTVSLVWTMTPTLLVLMDTVWMEPTLSSASVSLVGLALSAIQKVCVYVTYIVTGFILSYSDSVPTFSLKPAVFTLLITEQQWIIMSIKNLL